MYRKTYAGFVWWLIGFVAVLFGISFLPSNDPALLTRLIQNLCSLGMAVLTGMIWLNKRVYWYTGVSFEEAEKAGDERRRAYAFRHFRLFGLYALAVLGVTLLAHLMGWPWWTDFLLTTIGLIVAALYTIRYKL